MKRYPSISKDPIFGKQYICFDKLDGSNIRTEWTRKNGFSKFGSRKVLIDETSLLGEAVELINVKYEKLHDIFRKERLNKVICFFEFYGENSNFGQHEDEPHTVTLIDVNIYKKGIIDPRDFIKMFSNVETPKVLYRGNFGKQIFNQIKSSELPGITFEGVVCKGLKEGKRPQHMFKVKTQKWLDKLYSLYENAELIKELE